VSISVFVAGLRQDCESVTGRTVTMQVRSRLVAADECCNKKGEAISERRFSTGGISASMTNATVGPRTRAQKRVRIYLQEKSGSAAPLADFFAQLLYGLAEFNDLLLLRTEAADCNSFFFHLALTDRHEHRNLRDAVFSNLV
jgi:hypothetical protein